MLCHRNLHFRVLLVASHLGCLEEALWIISALSADSIYIADIKGSKEDVERARAKFVYFLMLMNINSQVFYK